MHKVYIRGYLHKYCLYPVYIYPRHVSGVKHPSSGVQSDLCFMRIWLQLYYFPRWGGRDLVYIIGELILWSDVSVAVCPFLALRC